MEKIKHDWKEFGRSPRKDIVANFKLKTGHDCLLARISKEERRISQYSVPYVQNM